MQKICKECNVSKPEEDFYLRKTRKGVSYRCGVCKECKNKKERARKKSSLDVYLKASLSSRKWDANKKNIEHTLDLNYMLDLFKLQKGICPYTKTKLDYTKSRNMNSKESISLDRWDCSKGYVKGNVMFLSGRANVIKNNQTLEEFKIWMPSWYSEGLNLINKIRKTLDE